MLIPVGVLAVGSMLVGWLQVPGGWHAVSNWLDPVVPPLVDPSNTQEAIASVVSVALGLVGIAVAWWIYVARRRPAPAASPALEHKLWFDELYDAVFYRPAVATAKTLYAVVEGPLVGGSMTGSARPCATSARRPAACRPGSSAPTSLLLAASLAVLAIVFLAVR